MFTLRTAFWLAILPQILSHFFNWVTSFVLDWVLRYDTSPQLVVLLFRWKDYRTLRVFFFPFSFSRPASLIG